MSKRAVRAGLFLILVAAIAAGGYELLRVERHTAVTRSAYREFDDVCARAVRAAADFRSAQQALLVPQQGIDWWDRKATESAGELDAALATLRQLASTPEALSELDAAAAALGALRHAHGRIVLAVLDQDRATAATLVFGEGLEQANAILDRLASARDAEARSRVHEGTLLVQRNAAVAGAIALVALLVSGLLLVRGRTQAEAVADAQGDPTLIDLALAPRAGAAFEDAGVADARTAAPPPERAHAPVTAEPAASASATTASVPAVQAGDAGLAGPPPPSRDRRKAPELRAAADLCTDFARLLDPEELPALLERASRLLDAQGLIVWIADPAGGELRPTLAHGYPAHAISRLPSIGREDDNATAAAFRYAELQVVKTNGMEPGAVAVPLLTPSGCVGVLAAEVRHGREASESFRAISRIVAAQLATLVQVRPASEIHQEATG